MIVRYGKYDSALCMYVNEPREPDMARLRFLRWLAEGGWLEHEALSKPTGQYAESNRK